MNQKKDFNSLSPDMQQQIVKNHQDMHIFYSLPLGERDAILDRIASLNSKKEIEAFEGKE